MQPRVVRGDFSTLIWRVVSTTLPALVFFGLGPMPGNAQTATDPGIRTGALGAGGFLPCGPDGCLNSYQVDMETPATNFTEEVNIVAGGANVKRVGLGARFDSNSCNSCHAQVGVGGGSPAPCGLQGSLFPTCGNQLSTVYNLMGATNELPFFETQSGPTLVARAPYQSDLTTPYGHVEQLFTITGRTDAGTCDIQQPDFELLSAENNLIFRNTPPFFGEGLMEIINDSDIIANMNSNLTLKMSLGISGHPNVDPDDGSVDRLGWKAQHRSLLEFIGEAYDVEEGIDNEFFPNKTDETPGCTPPFPLGPPNGNGTHGVPDDRTDWADLPATGYLMPGDIERFAIFGRLLAQPTPGACPTGGDCVNGQTQFNNVGCVLCHTTSFTTPPSSIAAAGQAQVNLFSDLLVHDMGVCDADNVTQGQATGDEFKTAPLWGVGQRYFFMHDGRTSDIVTAVEDHYCDTVSPIYPLSEANGVINAFNALDQKDQQDLIDFLRSL